MVRNERNEDWKEVGKVGELVVWVPGQEHLRQRASNSKFLGKK